MFKRPAPIIPQAYWIDFCARQYLQGETMSDNIPLDVQRDPTTSTAGLNRVSSIKEPILLCRPDENAAMSEGMSRFEAAINFVFGVVLPTVDVGSDFLLAFQLIRRVQCGDRTQQKIMDEYYFLWGGVSFICPSLSFLFVTYHWWQLEKPKNRLKTMPFLLAQVWPQYRMLKMIYKGYIRKDPRWRDEQTVIQENIMGVEPFIESVPQCFWFVYLLAKSRGCVGESDGIIPLPIVAFITSVLSAAYGLTNFLRVGPLKTVQNQPASGFGHPSFWLVFLTNLSILVARGFLLVNVLWVPGPDPLGPESLELDPLVPDSPGLGMLALPMLLPQFFLVVLSLLITTGFNLLDTFKLVAKFPAIALMPVFTPFTLGPDTVSCRCGRQQGSMMRLHYGFTVLNLVLTAIGFFCYFYIDADWMISDHSNNHGRHRNISDYDNETPIDTPFKYLKWDWLNFSGSCGLFLLAAILTTTLILTDIMACCTEKIKPKRTSRAIDSLLVNPRSTKDREASREHNPGQPEEIPLVDIESALAVPVLANPQSKDRDLYQTDNPGNPGEIPLGGH